MGIGRLIAHALALPPHLAAAKAAQWGGRIALGYARQARLRNRCTFATADGGTLEQRVPLLAPSLLQPHAAWIGGVAAETMAGRFDLLGSGWVAVTREDYAPVSPGNAERTAAIRARIGPDHRPIDWQRDFKSGYRWSERSVAATVRYGHVDGVDIKVPWELARLQHLTTLALAFVLAEAGHRGVPPAAACTRALEDQVLDFLAANPPGFGVNWACTMDVAIRAANLLVAVDLFRRHGARLDSRFLDEVAAAAWAHGRHVAAHVDRESGFRGNHTLTALAGLLFVAAYLPSSRESNGWLAHAGRRMVAETERQFGPDGANFEASTSYHRLSAETVIHATALMAGMPEERRQFLPAFPGDWWERIFRMARFSADLTKPDGRVIQTGDNDSGRFFKLFPVYRRTSSAEAKHLYANLAGWSGRAPDADYWDEEHLDHRSLIAAAAGLVEAPRLAAFAGPGSAAETAFVRGLAGMEPRRVAGESAPEAWVHAIAAPEPEGAVHEVLIELPDPRVLDGLTPVAYPDFGLFLWRGRRLFLAVRCGPVGQEGRGGHAHNDQLALELQIDGIDWLADPGTFVYTPSPERREAYRSVKAHAAPRQGDREPMRRPLGLFRLDDSANAHCLRFDRQGFVGMHHGFGSAVHRTVVPGEGKILIRDIVAESRGIRRVTVRDREALQAEFPLAVPFSPGYGKIWAG